VNYYKKQRLLKEPLAVYAILAVTTLVFLYMEVIGPLTGWGNSQSGMMLIRMGAMWAPLVRAGQWWRFITPIFLHIGWTHFLMNMFTLYFMGRLMEEAYGHVRFLIVYLLSGILGNILSFSLSSGSVSAGASTSLFGMFAGFAVLKLFFPENKYIQLLSRQYMMLIGINLAMNLFMPSVDMMGHVGGAIGGALIGIVVAIPGNTHRYKLHQRVAAGICFVGIAFICLYFGYFF
jgi:rhomboid protease GluP